MTFYKVPTVKPKVGDKVHEVVVNNDIVRATDLLTISKIGAYRPVEAQWRVEVLGRDDDVIIAWGDSADGKEEVWLKV